MERVREKWVNIWRFHANKSPTLLKTSDRCVNSDFFLIKHLMGWQIFDPPTPAFYWDPFPKETQRKTFKSVTWQSWNDPFYCGRLKYMGVNSNKRKIMVDFCTLHSNREVMVFFAVHVRARPFNRDRRRVRLYYSFICVKTINIKYKATHD